MCLHNENTYYLLNENTLEMKTKTRSEFLWENQDFSVKSTLISQRYFEET